ncbi:MAG: hypothetical protein R3C19_09935 [Planctomycetaceae bacterium]
MGETRIYFLGDYFTGRRLNEILNASSPEAQSRMGGSTITSASEMAAWRIAQIIMAQSGNGDPQQWIDENGNRRIAVLGFSLVVTQTYENHRQIDQLLKLLAGTTNATAEATMTTTSAARDTADGSVDDTQRATWFVTTASGWIVSILLSVALWMTNRAPSS